MKNKSPSRRRSPRKKDKEGYQMNGIGSLLLLYGQAGGEAERKARALKSEIKVLKNKIANENDKYEKARMKSKKNDMINEYYHTKNSLKQLLSGASQTTLKAAAALSDSNDSNDSNKSDDSNSIEERRKNLRSKYQKWNRFARKSPSPSQFGTESESNSSN